MKTNAMTILKYATAYPFRLPEIDVMCILCNSSFEDPKDFRDHFDNEHKQFNVKKVFRCSKVKVDCTDLSCRICDESFDAVDDVADHLITEHGIEISADGFAFEIFKFGSERWTCAYCQMKFISLRMLSRHTASHFRNFVCPSCGKAYTYINDLKKHTLVKHSKKFRCIKCNEDFPSIEDRNKHRRLSQACWQYRCQYCGERFTCQTKKDKHLESVHGRSQRAFKCPSCPLEFASYSLANSHYVVAHTEKFVCTLCGKKLASPKALRLHNDRHTGNMAFQCDVCDKGDSQDAMTTNMRNNAMKIVEYATAYPFRLPELDVMCVLCSRSFEDPKDFRDHFDNDHKVFNIKEAFFHLTRFDRKLKVDFTDVRCRICNQLFDDLDSVANHLKAEHDKEISNDGYALEIFKFEPGKWVCAYCKEKFVSLRSLSRHTACHFRNFVCPTCGKKYTFDRDLDEHIKKKHSNLFACVKCRKTFPSDKDRKEHMEESISCWPNTCMYCKEKFKSDTSRIKHMQQIHGMAARVFKCTACLLEFPSIRVRGYHFVKEHTDKFVCSICGQKFATQKRLQVHIDRHAGLKKFKCDVCNKGFVMKCELVQHYWAHREDKRFECKLCNKKFNQKVTWKGHMKSKHPELVDF
ncbi:hypothetical protein JYU34_017919 [Plutella xylostella]|uniref:C2H2-type domain-containing protein n=1 Tax=Plutella xylostella TaxID=51655 RepID=A0ABQ7PZB0_PLUXY|nr:hypothetical protein JYU34_017919 [Plutella xylostella]